MAARQTSLPMASNKAVAILQLPLEIRHAIFEYAAVRDTKAKKLFRYWFEKKEIKELIAEQSAANPDGQAPRVVYDDGYDDDSDIEQAEDDSGEEGSEDDEDDAESEEDEEIEEADDDEDDHQDDEDQDDQIDDLMDEDQGNVNHVVAPSLATVHTNNHVQAATQGQNNTENADADEEMDEDTENHTINGEDSDVDIVEDDAGGHAPQDDEVQGSATSTAVLEQPPPPPPPPPPAPVVRAARKWRYIPNFMRITQCPPPIDLLLTSKQLSAEAKDWFYDVAVLRIEATGSFAHTSFFEEAFSQITEAAFSPMENIRKVEVTFVWDTTWLRADMTGSAAAIFPALLRQRSDFVFQILSQAPDLKEVTIHWHDSAQDDESANFMLDILSAFHTLPASVKILEHYIAADAKPHSRSIAGKRRVEFQSIVDAGLDRLF